MCECHYRVGTGGSIGLLPGRVSSHSSGGSGTNLKEGRPGSGGARSFPLLLVNAERAGRDRPQPAAELVPLGGGQGGGVVRWCSASTACLPCSDECVEGSAGYLIRGHSTSII